jgi:polyisoprenoid-binding protein YceI
MSLASAPTIPVYQAGIWEIDPVHSEASFVVRHMVVSKVRGGFGQVEGNIVLADEPLRSHVDAHIEAASIDTNNDQRDAHVRSGEFLDTDNHPTITFASTAVRQGRDRFLLDGDLTIRRIDQAGHVEAGAERLRTRLARSTRAGFSAHTEMNRRAFGVSYR